MRPRSVANATLLLLSSCAWRRLPDEATSGPSWPPLDPRVALERIVIDRGDVGSRAFFGRGEDEPLFARPYGVAWDGDDLLVADPGAHRVFRIPPRGSIQSTDEDLLRGPVGVASCPVGVVVTDPPTGRVALLDGRLRLVRWLSSGLSRPTGVVCSEDRIYVVETAAHRIVVMNERGPVSFIGERGEGPGQFNFPTSIAEAGGSLFIGDTLNFRVQRLDSRTGRLLGVIGQLGDAPGQMPRNKGVAVDAEGHLWVSDATLDQVALYDGEGSFLMDLGRRGNGPGEFSFPAGIAANRDGRVAVADSLNRRIQVFRLLHELEGPPS